MPIKSLSPYYVTTPWSNPLGATLGEDYTITILVWNGTKASPPTATSANSYIITKENPTNSTGNDKINIARLINDFIVFTPQTASVTGEIDGNNQWWIKQSITYENDATIQQVATSLFTLGFSYGDEGENIILISGNNLLSNSLAEYRADRNAIFIVPILIDESVTTSVTVVSSPDSEINYSSTIAATTDSAKLVQYVWIELDETTTDTTIVISKDAAKIATVIIKDAFKYTPVDIVFQNKEGGQEVITFFKEKIDSLNITKETYESDSGQPSSGNHQFKDYNVQARSSFSINSGFVHESYNDVFKELMLSKRIWTYENATMIPINIKTSNIEYKTRQRNRLINYLIEYEYSYNEVNNI